MYTNGTIIVILALFHKFVHQMLLSEEQHKNVIVLPTILLEVVLVDTLAAGD